MPTDPRQIVARGYDIAAAEYAEWSTTSVTDTARTKYVEAFSALLPEGAQVLELGCGGGGPTTQQLARRFQLTGIDISATQVELARLHVPHATFHQADMTQFIAPPASFDGIAALYSLIHLPQGELPAMLTRIAEWLREGGILLATLSGRDQAGEHIEPSWLGGAPMYWSGYRLQDTYQFLGAAGLTLIEHSVEADIEDGEEAPFLWIIARKPAPST